MIKPDIFIRRGFQGYSDTRITKCKTCQFWIQKTINCLLGNPGKMCNILSAYHQRIFNCPISYENIGNIQCSECPCAWIRNVKSDSIYKPDYLYQPGCRAGFEIESFRFV